MRVSSSALTIKAIRAINTTKRAAMSSPQDLARISSEEFKSWIDSLDTFLCDCDGVLWRGDNGIEGVSKTIDALRARRKRVRFVTNNSTKSRKAYVSKLYETAGITCEPEEIISSAYAAAEYCRREGLHKKLYVIGGAGLVQEIQDASPGVEILGPEDWGREFSFGTLDPKNKDHLDPDVQAVVIGFDSKFTYYKLAKAAMHLRYTSGCKFIATNKDKTYPDAFGLVPGGGSIIASLESGSGRQPDVVAGKPSLQLLDLIDDGKLDRSRTCMVGDRLDTDILFGNKGGLRSTLLVLTGISSLDDVNKLNESDPLRPTCYLSSFGELWRLLESID
jgi:4-nitrophenyl phosphatase